MSMKMSLKDVHNCLEPGLHACKTCKFNNQEEFDCRGTALKVGATAVQYMMVGQKLLEEEERKNDLSI